MNPFVLFYNEILFNPLLNLLIGTTNVLPGHTIGWSIIIVTIIVRLILFPSSYHQAKVMQRNQGKMKALQDKLATAKAKHKDSPNKQAEETMRIYKEAGVNPASGCLPLLIQLPILIALYRVFLSGLSPEALTGLYSFVSAPGQIDFAFFGINLQDPSLRLGVLAGIAQFIQMKYLSPTPPPSPSSGSDNDAASMQASLQRNMSYIFPVMTIFFALQFPAALSLYWFVSTLIGIGQQYLLKRSMHLSGNPIGV